MYFQQGNLGKWKYNYLHGKIQLEINEKKQYVYLVNLLISYNKQVH